MRCSIWLDGRKLIFVAKWKPQTLSKGQSSCARVKHLGKIHWSFLGNLQDMAAESQDRIQNGQ